MATNEADLVPSINPENHGPKIIIVGGIMLAATILMIAIAGFNRFHAKTTHHKDIPMLLLGAATDIGCFAVVAVAVSHGFGKRVFELDRPTRQYVARLFLGSMLLFFASHGIVKLSYNLLARRTGRSKKYQRVMDVFSVIVGLWMLANIIVIAVALRRTQSPHRSFFYASGSISIAIVLGQLLAFLWIIWRTKAPVKVKIRWSMSMGAFVPLCVAVIITRLAYTPKDYLSGDWTFNDVVSAVLFQIELNIMTMTVLAPNLPVFFQRASTGGVYFLPGEATNQSRRATDVSQELSLKLNQLRWSGKGEAAVYDGNLPHTTLTSTVSGTGNNGLTKKPSFDSDVILMQRSFEVGSEPNPDPAVVPSEPCE